LLEQEVHPTVIARGYHIASEKSMEILNEMAEAVKPDNKDVLKKIAMTAMTGKGAESHKDLLAELTVKAVQQVADGKSVDIRDIKIEKKVGDGVDESELIQGVVLDKERVHSGMPKKIENAKIAILDVAVEIKNTETDAKIQISDPSQMGAFLEQEAKMIRDMVDKIVKSGATVVVCQKGIDDLAQHYLSKNKIYATRRVKKSDMDMLAKATGGRVVSSLDDLSKEDLGHAGVVEELKVGDEDMTYVRECKNPKAVTMLLRGGTQHVVDEIERAVKDAVGDVIAGLKVGKVVAGAGAPEVELARKLRLYANTLNGREQLAVLSFADSVEIIPRTLAENAGLDPIDVLTDLKNQHDKNMKFAGINVFTGKVMDAWKEGVIEPLKIKTQAVKSASEVAEMILRIDDVIAGAGDKGPKMPAGMPPDMGGAY
jgi:thermosome